MVELLSLWNAEMARILFLNCIDAADESVTHPPSPVLFLLSSEGVLVCYYMIYTAASVARVNSKPESLTGVCTRKRQGIS